jgi:hypothetical protein
MAWPPNMTVAPIREWPGAITPRRTRSNFSARWSDTLELLSREMRQLQAKNAELLVAIPADQFRLDGYPRATARADHPGIIISFDSTVGHLSYPCDAFDRWEDNLRAVALALEALRKVDRYGVTKRGEQYRGFLALEATAAPAGFSTSDAALAFLIDLAGVASGEHPSVILRRAQRAAHPDTGGDAATFQRVSLAESKLRAEGLVA